MEGCADPRGSLSSPPGPQLPTSTAGLCMSPTVTCPPISGSLQSRCRLRARVSPQWSLAGWVVFLGGVSGQRVVPWHSLGPRVALHFRTAVNAQSGVCTPAGGLVTGRAPYPAAGWVPVPSARSPWTPWASGAQIWRLPQAPWSCSHWPTSPPSSTTSPKRRWLPSSSRPCSPCLTLRSSGHSGGLRVRARAGCGWYPRHHPALPAVQAWSQRVL